MRDFRGSLGGGLDVDGVTRSPSLLGSTTRCSAANVRLEVKALQIDVDSTNKCNFDG
jgi:hypothetical protein